MPRIATFFILLQCSLPQLTTSAAPLSFEKLLAISGADQVRVECSFSSDEKLGPIDLTGTITRDPTGQVLWQGSLGRADISGTTSTLAVHTVSGLKPALWEPAAPALYQLKVSAKRADTVLAERAVRFGFRSIEIRDGQFHLNGRPIFLRGIAINPPGRTIPPAVGESRAFAEAYVRCLKSENVNIFRITTDESQVWFDVCDELGMMMYAGRYGSPPGAEEGKRVAPTDFDKCITGYRKLLEGYASHPSIVMYLLANELPVSGERGKMFSALLTRAHEELKRWDSTRPYIGNAGYGEGREGDVCDVHRYWGWYYNSFLTYYNLRDKLYPAPLFGDPAKNQPLTFTECVGSFTGWDGEFNIVRSKQLAPQLGWTGHSSTQRDDALRYQAFMVKQATESFRRLRPLNPRLSGIMPFTILFYNWSGISSFDQMKPKPAMEQMGVSYQPVLLSWELWTPQVYAGTTVRAIAHVINDAEDGQALENATLNYLLRSKQGVVVLEGKIQLPRIPYYGTRAQPITLDLPSALATGQYTVSGNVLAGSRSISTNSVDLYIAGDDWKASPPSADAPVLVYDPPGKTALALEKIGIRFNRVSDLASLPAGASSLVIGDGAADNKIIAHTNSLQQFLRDGGRILCLLSDSKSFNNDWLPEKVSFFTSSPNDTDYPPRTRPFREQMNVNPERPGHPVFRGLDRYRLALWSDYTGWDETRPGFPRLYPVTAGFKLDQPDALSRTAILADYDRGLEGIALCEMFSGKGSVILSAFDLVNRAGLDPAADRLLANLVAYTASQENHPVYPLIEKPIVWGNYESERGLVCGSLNGLLVNAEWLAPPTNPTATALRPNAGSWNMDPGSQFVPRGRNPFGPYGYTTGSSLKDLNPDSESGTGVFWASVPSARKAVITRVKNPSTTPSKLTVAVNKATADEPVTIPSGQTMELRSALPEGARDVSVRYTGNKTLELLETRFE